MEHVTCCIFNPGGGVNSMCAHFKPCIKFPLFLLFLAHPTALPLWPKDYSFLAVSDLFITVPFSSVVSFTAVSQIAYFDQIML